MADVEEKTFFSLQLLLSIFNVAFSNIVFSSLRRRERIRQALEFEITRNCTGETKENNQRHTRLVNCCIMSNQSVRHGKALRPPFDFICSCRLCLQFQRISPLLVQQLRAHCQVALEQHYHERRPLNSSITMLPMRRGEPAAR